MFCLLLFEGTFTGTSFFKDKKSKEVTKQKESRFFLLFLLDDRRIRIRIHTSDQWIRIRAQKHVDPEDRDPEHCFKECAIPVRRWCRWRPPRPRRAPAAAAAGARRRTPPPAGWSPWAAARPASRLRRNTSSRRRMAAVRQSTGINAEGLSLYLGYQSVCLVVPIGPPPLPSLPQESGSPPPPEQGGGQHSLVGKGANSDNCRESLALCILCGYQFCILRTLLYVGIECVGRSSLQNVAHFLILRKVWLELRAIHFA